MNYIKLLRPKEWAKNLFIFIPLFFAGEILNLEKIASLVVGFVSFSSIASSVYIINDYLDIEEDRIHAQKCKRPLASGEVDKVKSLILCLFLVCIGFILAYLLKVGFLLILVVYFLLNLGYSLGIKKISILDILILAIGFVLRTKAGAIIESVFLSEWIIIMIFLLALFMAISKRRDDMLLKLSSGLNTRESLRGYSLEFLNVLLTVICGAIIVAYLMYAISNDAMSRLGTRHLYYTSLFVVAGIMRYLQIIFVTSDSGSPTDILYRDKFIQITLLLWIASFIIIIYLKGITI